MSSFLWSKRAYFLQGTGEGRSADTHVSEQRYLLAVFSSLLREAMQMVKEEEGRGKPLCSYCGAPLFESCSGCSQGTLAPISRQLSNSLDVYAFPLP